MKEVENNNKFRLSLHQENVLLCETYFDAEIFNPYTRRSIDVRSILPDAIRNLQKVLSKREYDVIYERGLSGGSNPRQLRYNLYSSYINVLNSFPKEYYDELKYNPQPVTQQFEDKIIKGVECKLGLYINDNPIVERLFYVNGFNPVSRWSLDLTYSVLDISNLIYEKIKKSDIANMWYEYDQYSVFEENYSEI